MQCKKNSLCLCHMESATAHIVNLLCCVGGAPKSPCDVAGVVASASAQLRLAWSQSVDAGRVASASAFEAYRLLELLRELEWYFLRCLPLCGSSCTSLTFQETLQKCRRQSDAAFALVCGLISQAGDN